jgi:hypothetical protein
LARQRIVRNVLYRVQRFAWQGRLRLFPPQAVLGPTLTSGKIEDAHTPHFSQALRQWRAWEKTRKQNATHSLTRAKAPA